MTKTSCAKCPTCGQEMPAVEGWKAEGRSIVWSHHEDGTLVWIADGEEGAVIGEFGHKGRGALRIRLKRAVKAYLADRSEGKKEDVDTYAVELAAIDLAPTLASEEVRPGRPISWKKAAKAALVQRANMIAAEAVKVAQEEAKT